MSNLQTCSARDASTYLGNPCQTSWYLQLDFFLPTLQSEYLLLEFITATFYTDYKRNILHSAHHEHSEFVSLLQQSMLSGKTAAVFLVTLLFCGQTSDLFPSCSLIWSSQLFLKWLFTKWGIQLQCCRKYRPGVVCTVGSRPVQEYQCRFPHFCNKRFC